MPVRLHLVLLVEEIEITARLDDSKEIDYDRWRMYWSEARHSDQKAMMMMISCQPIESVSVVENSLIMATS